MSNTSIKSCKNLTKAELEHLTGNEWVFIVDYRNGKTVKHMARVNGLSESTVRRTIQRGLERAKDPFHVFCMKRRWSKNVQPVVDECIYERRTMREAAFCLGWTLRKVRVTLKVIKEVYEECKV